MKYTLIPFQEVAARQVVSQLTRAIRGWRTDDSDYTAISLSAITGAGKTVMATAVIEAFVRGNDIGDADPNVTFLWVTDDPALNRQTRTKMLSSSDRLRDDDIVIIDEAFDAAMLDPGKVYVLNIHKLGGSSSMIRRSDRRRHSLMDTIRATATNSPQTLVMVADEAHRGMKSISDRATIMQTLVRLPIPVVWGISATMDRFRETMYQMAVHSMNPPIVVNNDDVRRSGLLKKTIVLQRPDGRAQATVLREATTQLADLDRLWGLYCASENIDRVVPAMVVQVGDKASPSYVAGLLETINDAWESETGHRLDGGAFAHVFGEHNDVPLGAQRALRYVAPESVAGDNDIRIVIAKTAITTGWDCPRAEVMCSLRGARDTTYIAQLLGRIIRTPLTRTIDDHDALNTAYAYLPLFNEKATASIVSSITEPRPGEADLYLGIDVAIGKVELQRNPHVPQEVFDVLGSLTSVVAPHKSDPALKRAYALATALVNHNTTPSALTILERYLHAQLDGYVASHHDDMERAIEDVSSVTMHETIVTDVDTSSVTSQIRRVVATQSEIEAAYESAKKVLTNGLHETYRAHLVRDLTDDDDEGFERASLTVAALARRDDMETFLERVCTSTIETMWNDSAHQRSLLSPAQRAEYDDIQARSGQPFDAQIVVPERSVATQARIVNGSTEDFPLYRHHVLSNEHGDYPARLNTWERDVVRREMNREGFVAWYRNPAHAGPYALRIAVRTDSGWTSMQPDFIFFYKSASGVRAVIVDPHGSHLDDAAARMHALASYASRYAHDFARIDAVSQGSRRDGLRCVNLVEETTRNAAMSWDDASIATLFDDLGKDYQ